MSKETGGKKSEQKYCCADCDHLGGYGTGGDEYPAYTYISYCKMDIWENGPTPDKMAPDTFPICSFFSMLKHREGEKE